MADLTLYFTSTGSAPHDCAYDAAWENTAYAAHFPATDTKGSTAMAARTPYRLSGQTLGCGGQWVSPAQSAREWTTNDTFDFVMLFRDQNAPTTTSYAYLVINIFNAAGDTLVGNLYSGIINATAMVTSFTSRHATGVSVQNAVSCPEGGHIVVEVGMSAVYAASFATGIVVGEGTSTALLLNDTQTNTDLYSWIAFTYGEAPPSGYANEVCIVFES
jgi:hypothetical protein